MQLKKIALIYYTNMFIHVLGTAQDGGYPQIGCNEACCNLVWKNPELKKYPSSLAVVDQSKRKYWIFDITPEVKSQVHLLNSFECSLSGIFITHAHIGHYMGLINLGLEVMNLKEIPVYIMPRMRDFIMGNTLLNQLVENNNINLITLEENQVVGVNNLLSVEAFSVPHRNELSETVGYKIIGKSKTAIYLPDIDSWRNSLHRGLIHRYKESNIVLTGGVDDIWIVTMSKQLIVVDKKSQTKNVGLDKKDYQDDPCHEGYKMQIDFYA